MRLTISSEKGLPVIQIFRPGIYHIGRNSETDYLDLREIPENLTVKLEDLRDVYGELESQFVLRESKFAKGFIRFIDGEHFYINLVSKNQAVLDLRVPQDARVLSMSKKVETYLNGEPLSTFLQGRILEGGKNVLQFGEPEPTLLEASPELYDKVRPLRLNLDFKPNRLNPFNLRGKPTKRIKSKRT